VYLPDAAQWKRPVPSYRHEINQPGMGFPQHSPICKTRNRLSIRRKLLWVNSLGEVWYKGNYDWRALVQCDGNVFAF
jgi:hypothetical protein